MVFSSRVPPSSSRRVGPSHCLLVCLALLTGVPLGLFGCSSEEEASGPFLCPQPCDLHQIVWTGDTLLGADGKHVLKKRGLHFPFEYLKPLLVADYAIGNAEASITKRREKFNKKQRWSYNTPPEVAEVLKSVGFTAVSLSNNHTFDRGPKGLADTMRFLDRAGVAHFGAGPNEEVAYRPLIIETPHGKVGVVALQKNNSVGQEAKGKRAGTAWLSESTVKRGIEKARKLGAKWVVGYIHWGKNYTAVRRRQERAAQWFADAGYDLIIGHGAHSPQRVDRIGDMPILYSLGNFAFTTRGRFDKLKVEHLGYGLVARTFLGPKGFEGIEVTCIATNNLKVRYQARPCTEEESGPVFASLGEGIQIVDGLGRIRF